MNQHHTYQVTSFFNGLEEMNKLMEHLCQECHHIIHRAKQHCGEYSHVGYPGAHWAFLGAGHLGERAHAYHEITHHFVKFSQEILVLAHKLAVELAEMHRMRAHEEALKHQCGNLGAGPSSKEECGYTESQHQGYCGEERKLFLQHELGALHLHHLERMKRIHCLALQFHSELAPLIARKQYLLSCSLPYTSVFHPQHMCNRDAIEAEKEHCAHQIISRIFKFREEMIREARCFANSMAMHKYYSHL